MKSLLKFPLLVAVATMMTCSFSAVSYTHLDAADD